MERRCLRELLCILLLLGCAAWAQSAGKSPAASASRATACLGYAQHPDLRPGGSNDPPVPTVVFRYEWEQVDPAFYGIAVESNGHAAYVSEPRKSNDDTSEPYATKFTISAATRERIFQLARDADFFQGDLDYTKGKIANTGAKTLSYADGAQCTQATYNWSENAAVQQLTSLFQGISATIEHGQRLAFLRRFDKLGLDAELKLMEDQAKSNQLEELQIIEPTLRAITTDTAIMHLARARAERLLAKIPPPTQSAP